MNDALERMSAYAEILALDFPEVAPSRLFAAARYCVQLDDQGGAPDDEQAGHLLRLLTG